MRKKIHQVVKLGIFEITGSGDLSCDGKLLSEVITDDIEALFTAQTQPLREALELALMELKLWLGSEECDCPPEGHICGLPRLEKSIAKIEAVLKEESK